MPYPLVGWKIGEAAFAATPVDGRKDQSLSVLIGSEPTL
jgi:hypothetical protein